MVVVKHPLRGYAAESPRVKGIAKKRVALNSRVLLISIAVIFVLLSFLIQTTQIYLTKNHIFQLEKQLNIVQEAYNSAHLRVAQLKSPDRIIPIAKEQCGLLLPREGQFVVVQYQK